MDMIFDKDISHDEIKTENNWRILILNWCYRALENIKSGDFNPRKDSKYLRTLYKGKEKEEKIKIISECQKILNASAYSLYELSPSSRIMDPKLTQYFGQKLIPIQCRLQ